MRQVYGKTPHWCLGGNRTTFELAGTNGLLAKHLTTEGFFAFFFFFFFLLLQKQGLKNKTNATTAKPCWLFFSS
jgi:hypothetical protein